ncbi:hypothetical protein EOI86_20575 [Hwanghaeella grinnelliae]|uniref:Uncharacterized protein n=1 Tax=Hwanghaeella grinnelliae TaxID=2500179 RepID=A0A3S3UMU4_9PROT|nr:hypothetical protein [Hwanghaeella grinnelliae]RVU35212.1 hypothetical protein EOI86_20575 [Hwanghaeella grinnelliae]
MVMRTRYRSLLCGAVASLGLVSCGPGVFDYIEDIGETGLQYADTSPINMVIQWHDPATGLQDVVQPSVLSYDYEDPYVFGFRQVVNWYDCDDNNGTAEVTDRYEFFVVTVRNAEERDYLTETFTSYAAFDADLRSKKIDPDDIDDFHPDEMSEYMMEPSPLTNCQNPVLM